MRKFNKSTSAFTLVELLIVVIILAILAAVVVPQFTDSTRDAEVSALNTTLANIRGAIDLYYQQHSGTYPSAVTSTGATCPVGGVAGTGAINESQAFIDQLAMYTDKNGQACTSRDATFKYGPYMKKNTLPENPITGNSTLVISIAGVLNMTGNTTAAGWKFDNLTGQFISDDANFDDL